MNGPTARRVAALALSMVAPAAARLGALCESLAPAQRPPVDRRVWLSQSDPLGTQ